MNPFQLKPEKETEAFMNWQQLYPRSYDKRTVDPYTRVRVILMNGTEFESAGYSHQFQRHESNNDLRRELAMMRRQEQQQQKKIACLKPMDETVLEHTIGYEQLAVDLTAGLAQRVTCAHVKSALDFALLEDFDHLYRYADLMEMEHGEYAERLVGGYTEIMPGRPTISEHRCPMDALCMPGKPDAQLFDKLAVQVITAAEQQTMNYYMNVCGLYTSDLGRKLYQEIGMIEEQHVTQYGSLMDPACTWLEGLLMHQYVEAWLYWSCMEDETDSNVKKVWESFFQMEVAHLHKAAELLKTYEKKDWQQVIPGGEFPDPFRFEPNIEYYLMGVGTPQNILESVERGVDFFDCVYPSRNGRHGHVYTNHGHLNMFNAKYETDPAPIEEGCGCPTCRNFSRAYIRHLLKANEMLGMRLCVQHNLWFYNTMMEEIRDSLDAGNFSEYKKRKLAGIEEGERSRGSGR